MSNEPVILDGGESPLASKLQAGATSAEAQLQSSAAHSDGGPAPTSAEGHASPFASSSDQSGVASSGGIMRPRSG